MSASDCKNNKERNRKHRIPIVGLTGGIGSGQSTVAEFFKSFGAVIINADTVGNDLLLDKDMKDKIVKEFGSGILNDKDEVERKTLGEIVFNNEEYLHRLNALMHPVMIERICERINGIIGERRYKMVVVDAALIFEAGKEEKFDYIITVSSKLEERIKRIKQRDKLQDKEINKRIHSQMPLEEKVKRADFVITNDCSFKELRIQSKKVFNGILTDFIM